MDTSPLLIRPAPRPGRYRLRINHAAIVEQAGPRGDYAEVLDKALRVVAHVERRKTTEVLSDLSAGGADTLAIKLATSIPAGEAPLAVVHAAVVAMRSLVVASASAALDVRGLVLPLRRPQRAASED